MFIVDSEVLEINSRLKYVQRDVVEKLSGACFNWYYRGWGEEYYPLRKACFLLR